MNSIFRTVWNAALASWVAVGEIGVLPRATSRSRGTGRLTGHRGHLKSSAPGPVIAATMLATIRGPATLALSAITLAILASMPVYAIPSIANPIVADGSQITNPVNPPAGTAIIAADPAVQGQPSRAVSAINGGAVNLNGGSVLVSYPYEKTWGLYADGRGSTITATGTDIVNQGLGTNGGNAPLGVDAEQGGAIALTNGSVTMTGANRAYAVRTMSGGTITTDGTDISTAANNSHAVQAYADTPATNGPSSITVTGGTVKTSGNNAYGLYAQNDGAVVNAAGVAVTTGSPGVGAPAGYYSLGVEAINGGAVNLAGGVSIHTNGDAAFGIDASGADPTTGKASKVTSTGTTIQTAGTSAIGIHASGTGSDVSFTGGSITTDGEGAAGAIASGAASVELTTTDVNINYANDNPVQPVDPVGLYATGSGSTITTNGTSLTMASDGLGSGDPAVGVKVDQGASASLTGGLVKMTGDTRAYGVMTLGGNSTLTTHSTDVSTAGTNSFGAYAYAGADGDPATIQGGSTLNLNGGNISTAGDGSYGLLAVNAGANLIAGNVNVTTHGATESTTGNKAFGAEALGGGNVALTGGTIRTSGAGASGLDASGIDSTTGRAATLAATNVAVTASGTGTSAATVSDGGSMTVTGGVLSSANGDGITLTDSGSVALNGTVVNATGASIASNLNTAGQTQTISVGSGSTLTQNNGDLLHVTRSTTGMDGVVNLTLGAGSTSSGQIVDTDGLDASGKRVGGGATNFVVQNGAAWTGVATGLNNAIVGQNGSFTHDGGGAIAGDLKASDNTSVTFNDTATVGGSVTTGANSTVAFNRTATIGQNVQSGANTSVAFNQAATIGGSLSASGAGSAVTFNDVATVGHDVQGTDANIAFARNATIGHNLTASGGSVTFAGAATIQNDVSGDNSAAIAFSKTSATTINGDLSLDHGASTHGGTSGTDKQITVAGNATVNNGAILGGNMTVSGNVSGRNGNLSPGNSVGTLTVGGLTGFSGTYNAEVNGAGLSDKIIVGGNADLSAINLSVGQENGNGGYQINTPYTILETSNGGTVQKPFASASLNTSFDNTLVELAPVQYDATDVKMSLAVDPAKVAAAEESFTHNQNAALAGGMATPGPNAMVNALFTSATAGSNFDQVSGESYASTRGALINDSRYIRDAANDRLLSAFSTPAPAVATTTLDADGKPVAATANGHGVEVWSSGFGSWGHADGENGSAKLSDSTSGIVVGADGLVSANTRAGVLFGYSHSNFDVHSLSSSTDSGNYHLGVYGGSQLGNVGIRAGAAYTWSDVSASRFVNFANFADHTSSSYTAGTGQAFAELGYKLNTRFVALEPYANIAYVNLRTGSFNESGGDAALHGDAAASNNVFSTVGVHGSTDFSIGRAALTATGTLGWQHAYGNMTPTTVVSFAGGQGFGVNGAPIARDAAVVGVGLDAAITDNLNVGASYSGQISGRTQDHGFMAILKYRF